MASPVQLNKSVEALSKQEVASLDLRTSFALAVKELQDKFKEVPDAYPDLPVGLSISPPLTIQDRRGQIQSEPFNSAQSITDVNTVKSVEQPLTKTATALNLERKLPSPFEQKVSTDPATLRPAKLVVPGKESISTETKQVPTRSNLIDDLSVKVQTAVTKWANLIDDLGASLRGVKEKMSDTLSTSSAVNSSPATPTSTQAQPVTPNTTIPLAGQAQELTANLEKVVEEPQSVVQRNLEPNMQQATSMLKTKSLQSETDSQETTLLASAPLNISPAIQDSSIVKPEQQSTLPTPTRQIAQQQIDASALESSNAESQAEIRFQFKSWGSDQSVLITKTQDEGDVWHLHPSNQYVKDKLERHGNTPDVLRGEVPWQIDSVESSTDQQSSRRQKNQQETTDE